ncbi:MAG: sporulation protein YlmC with PRC-barrel domain [Verrucomicrobiales bacterium]|jgi:sporulation protein YlmC with PRC-barrel domain
MKLNANDLVGTPLIDSAGDKLGKIKDLLFEDREWKVRYVVVDTGGWLSDRRVLVMPEQLLLTPDAFDDGKVPCTLTRETIENCPPLNLDAPVSRRYETEHAAYYQASPYWLGGVAWGEVDTAYLIPPSPKQEAEHDQAIEGIEQCHVRSSEEVEGYEVMDSNDVSLGEVEQFEIDWGTKEILNIVAKEGGLLQTIQEQDIAPGNVRDIDWRERRIHLSSLYQKGEIKKTSGTLAGTGLPAPQF